MSIRHLTSGSGAYLSRDITGTVRRLVVRQKLSVLILTLNTLEEARVRHSVFNRLGITTVRKPKQDLLLCDSCRGLHRTRSLDVLNNYGDLPHSQHQLSHRHLTTLAQGLPKKEDIIILAPLTPLSTEDPFGKPRRNTTVSGGNPLTQRRIRRLPGPDPYPKSHFLSGVDSP